MDNFATINNNTELEKETQMNNNFFKKSKNKSSGHLLRNIMGDIENPLIRLNGSGVN